MSNIEECKRLKESIQAWHTKTPEMEEELSGMVKVQAKLDEEALRAEILEERGWQEKKKAADENRSEISRTREKIAKCEEAIDILKEKEKQLQRGVIKELKEKHRPEYEMAIKAYAKKLRAAADAEEKVEELKRTVEVEAARILSSNGAGIERRLTILPGFRPILTGGPFTPENLTQYKYFLKNCKEQGIDVG